MNVLLPADRRQQQHGEVAVARGATSSLATLELSESAQLQESSELYSVNDSGRSPKAGDTVTFLASQLISVGRCKTATGLFHSCRMEWSRRAAGVRRCTIRRINRARGPMPLRTVRRCAAARTSRIGVCGFDVVARQVCGIRILNLAASRYRGLKGRIC